MRGMRGGREVGGVMPLLDGFRGVVRADWNVESQELGTYVHTYIHTCVYPSIHTYVYTSIHPSIHQSIHPSNSHQPQRTATTATTSPNRPSTLFTHGSQPQAPRSRHQSIYNTTTGASINNQSSPPNISSLKPQASVQQRVLANARRGRSSHRRLRGMKAESARSRWGERARETRGAVWCQMRGGRVQGLVLRSGD